MFLQTLSVGGNEFSAVLDNLIPETAYDIVVSGNVGNLKSNARKDTATTGLFLLFTVVTF